MNRTTMRTLVVAALTVGGAVATTADVGAGFDPGPINAISNDSPPFSPSVAFNPERSEYLAVYEVNPTEVRAVRLDAEGKALGASVPVAAQTIDSFDAPSVTYNGATDQYLVVWNQFNAAGPPGSSEARGRLFDDLGAPVGPDQPVHPAPTNLACRVQGVEVRANPATGGYTFVYVRHTLDFTGCDGDARPVSMDEQTTVQSLGANLEIGTPVEVFSGQAVTNIPPYLEVAPGTGQVVVGVHNNDSERFDAHLFSSTLAAGPVVGFDIPEEPGNDRYIDADAAWDATTDRWTVATSKFGLVSWMQTFDPSGTITMPPTQVSDGDFSTQQIEPVGDGTFALVTDVSSLTHVSGSGTVLGTADVFEPGGAAAQLAIAVDPSGPWVLGVGREAGTPPDVPKSRRLAVTDASATATPIAPARILETRSGPGLVTIDGLRQGEGKPGAGQEVALEVAGRGGVPADADAAFLNIAATGASQRGFVTAYPCGATRPITSNLNHPAGAAASAAAIVKLDDDGRACLFTSADAHLIVDVNGFVPSGGDVRSIVPGRLLETRPGESTVDGQFNAIGRVQPGSTTPVTAVGRAEVPADAEAVLVNVTAINPSGQTFATVYPCDATRPTAANLNAAPGAVVNNLVLAKVAADGTICVFMSAASDFVVDVAAYVPAGGGLVSIVPGRVLETRAGLTTIDGAQQGGGPIGAGQVVAITIGGRAGTSATAGGAVLNIAAIRSTGPGFITVYPCDEQRPTAANLNFRGGDVVSNAAFVKLDGQSRVCLFTNATTDLAVDVVGFVG